VVKYLSDINKIGYYRFRHPEACLILDTNILLLFLIGIYDKGYLKYCPLMTDNGKNYTEEHFDLLEKILKIFIGRIVITPQILAEVNSLSRIRLFKGKKLNEYFPRIIQEIEKWEENYIHFRTLLKEREQVIQFGFTDISIIATAKDKGYAILTDELDLYRNFLEQVAIISFSTIVAYELHKVGM